MGVHYRINFPAKILNVKVEIVQLLMHFGRTIKAKQSFRWTFAEKYIWNFDTYCRPTLWVKFKHYARRKQQQEQLQWQKQRQSLQMTK